MTYFFFSSFLFLVDLHLNLLGIDTDPVWRGFYLDSWPRKNKWPDVYFKTKGISKGGEGWRVCYLQRRLQDALNSRHALSKVTSCSSSEGKLECIIKIIIDSGKMFFYFLIQFSSSSLLFPAVSPSFPLFSAISSSCLIF